MTSKASKSRFEVAVTQSDIDRALQSNSAKCVVAQAIARTLPDATRIEVDTQTIRFTLGAERYAYLTPYSVTGYVIAFDAGDEIHPFRFRLYEEQKVAIRQRHRTEAGKVANKVNEEKRRAKAKAKASREKLNAALDRSDQLFTDPELPPPTPAEVAAIKAEIKAADAATKVAEEQAASVKAAYEGQRQIKPAEGGRDVPRVFKTKARHYGHRALRINQAQD
jgi:hypothetical protein